jgi:hypothetical protein
MRRYKTLGGGRFRVLAALFALLSDVLFFPICAGLVAPAVCTARIAESNCWSSSHAPLAAVAQIALMCALAASAGLLELRACAQPPSLA